MDLQQKIRLLELFQKAVDEARTENPQSESAQQEFVNFLSTIKTASEPPPRRSSASQMKAVVPTSKDSAVEENGPITVVPLGD